MSHSSAPETTVADPVLTAERAHLARAADCLTEMRAAASAVTDAGVDAWASERLGAARAERLRALAPTRTSRPSSAAPTRRAETFHIGRRHVRDAAGDPVVIDWRAPMSRPFYQASAADPQGLVRRRRFGFAGGELTGYEDELLECRGRARPSALLRAEIERPRSGPMRDIVATIQPDQDDIVRAPLARVDLRAGSAGYRQDRRRPAPGRLSALHARAGSWRAPASSSSGPTGRSCATSSRCCPPSARSTSTRPRWPSSPAG